MRRWCSVVCASLFVLAVPGRSALAGETRQAPASAEGRIRGRVVDTSRGAVTNARVTVTSQRGGAPVSLTSNARGEFEVALPPGPYVVHVEAAGFADGQRRLSLDAASTTTLDVVLDVAGVQEAVTVGVVSGYSVPAVTSATRTPTPLRRVPQAVAVVSRELIADQRMTSMADVARYMPGVGFAQGEGNRDTPILRGNSSTSDFFVDGVRDDVQYFRDVYNLDRVEALKGPSALAFGRGGVGGVINRVTRQADWSRAREASVQVGSWDNKRATVDVGQGLHATTAVRATGLYEQSDSYRDGVGLERYGVNPTVAVRLGPNTTLRGSYEFFHDERVADRGISSYQGRPVRTAASTFFGDPAQSRAEATVNVVSGLVEHRVNSHVLLKNRTSYGDYDKFYQNVFPGAVDATGTSVAISAYNNTSARQNLFNQTDLVVSGRTGAIGHTLLVGTEFGRQHTSNLRRTGFFTGLGANVTTFRAPLGAPTISERLEFRQRDADADNLGVTTIASVYAQDQVALSTHLEAVVGMRLDSFKADVTNNRTAARFSSHDNLVAPRLGLIYTPIAPVSIYGSYSLSYLPRAGEQLTSLSLTNQALDPEKFRNYEVGVKWDVQPALAVTTALYRLDRGNVIVPDPADPTVSLLVDAQRTRGLEIGLDGRLTDAWSVAGGYAYQDGDITRSISASAQAGATLAQLPKHSLSLWNKYHLTPRLATALGVIYRGDSFAATDNTVVLPAWTRVDAAVFYQLTAALRAQVNVENLLGEAYYLNAHSNTNITPGSPRAVRVSLTTRF